METYNDFKNTSLEEKRAFARDQYKYLKDNIDVSRLHLSRIFKAAGPGQIIEALKLSDSINYGTNQAAAKTSFYLILTLRQLAVKKLSRKQIEKMLKHLDIYIPNAHNDPCFFRVLDGAGEILFPGFHNFGYKTMQEIEDGLQKRIYEKDDVKNE